MIIFLSKYILPEEYKKVVEKTTIPIQKHLHLLKKKNLVISEDEGE